MNDVSNENQNERQLDPAVDIKKLRPIGVILILLLGVLTVIVCLTADMGIPEVYDSVHEDAYYMESDENMAELQSELEENVFPKFDGEISSWVEGGVLHIKADDSIASKVELVLKRDFDESLFYFENDEVDEK
jgi:hypothetical protein